MVYINYIYFSYSQNLNSKVPAIKKKIFQQFLEKG